MNSAATSMKPPATAPAAPWYAHRWPWLLMIGPLLVLVGGATAGYLAYSRPDAMVVDDYYKKGKAINQDLRRDRVASMMRIAFDARYSPAAGTLSGEVASHGQPLAAPFRIRLAHATLPQKDMVLEARPDAGGHFSVPLPMLERARWQVVVEGPQAGWRLLGSWSWPQQQALALRADPLAADTEPVR